MRQALTFVSVLFAFVACDRGPANADEAPKPAAPAAEQNFNLRIVPGDAKAGAKATSVVEFTPKAGFKMNTEFPSRLKLEATKGAKAAKDELGPGDAEVSEKAIRFNVQFTADAAGTVKMAGAADFSVCNEQTCKLVRGESVKWDVAVK